MSRRTLNYVVDTLGLLIMLALVGTGLLIKYVLPPGTGGGHGGNRWDVWGLSRHDWGGVHFWLAVGVAVMLVVHVILHWSWVVSTTERVLLRRQEGQCGVGACRHVFAVVLILFVVGAVGGFVWLADSSVTVTKGADDGHGAGDRHEGGGRHGRGHDAGHADHAVRAADGATIEIKGYMTLGQAAAAAGVDVKRLIARLGLPADTSPDEKLGRLMRGMGKDVDAVRQAVSAELAGH